MGCVYLLLISQVPIKRKTPVHPCPFCSYRLLWFTTPLMPFLGGIQCNLQRWAACFTEGICKSRLCSISSCLVASCGLSMHAAACHLWRLENRSFCNISRCTNETYMLWAMEDTRVQLHSTSESVFCPLSGQHIAWDNPGSDFARSSILTAF